MIAVVNYNVDTKYQILAVNFVVAKCKITRYHIIAVICERNFVMKIVIYERYFNNTEENSVAVLSNFPCSKKLQCFKLPKFVTDMILGVYYY